MAKYSKDDVINMQSEALVHFTSDSENWQQYCKSAAYLYKYRFEDTLLIAMQQPNATAVAPYETWKKLDAEVKKGSSGIPTLQNNSNRPVYVFDISQTTSTHSLWQADKNKVTAETIKMAFEREIDKISNSQNERLKNFVSESAALVIGSRCGIDINTDTTAFDILNESNNIDYHNVGSAVNVISRTVLKSIERTALLEAMPRQEPQNKELSDMTIPEKTEHYISEGMTEEQAEQLSASTQTKQQTAKKEADPNIIGNTEYKYIPKKTYRKFDREVALNIAEQLDKQDIKYSGRINGDSITLTVSKDDIEKFGTIAEPVIKRARGILSDTEIENAKNTNIVDFMASLGMKAKRVGINEYTLPEHDSMRINGNKFVWNSRDIKGNALNFAVEYLGMDFKSAVQQLNDFNGYAPPKEKNIETKPVRTDPIPNGLSSDTKRTYAYLTKTRHLSHDTVNSLIKSGLVGQDTKGNAVFKIYDKNNELSGAEIVGTSGKRFKQVTDRTQNGFVFCPANEKPQSAILFEAAIDALSYYELHKDTKALLISMSGVKDAVALNMTDRYGISRENTFTAVDNDTAGDKFAQKMQEEYGIKRLSLTDDEIYKRYDRPVKDWNELLEIHTFKTVENFRKETEKSFKPVHGFTAAEIEQTVKEAVTGVLEENGIDIEITDVIVSGSRSRGIENADSDLDIVLEYKGNYPEDSLFNLLNDEETRLDIGGIAVDINPKSYDFGNTLETYLPTVEEYLREKAENYAQVEQNNKLTVDSKEIFIADPNYKFSGTWSVVSESTENGRTVFELENDKYGYTSEMPHLLVDEDRKILGAKPIKAEKDNIEISSTENEYVIPDIVLESMPDTSISPEERNNYGYMWNGMLPLSAERAKELFRDFPIYVLYEDDTEHLIESIAEMDKMASDNYMFGIEADVWEKHLEELKEPIETEKSHLKFNLSGNGIKVIDTSKTNIFTGEYLNVAYISNEGAVKYLSNIVSDTDKKLIQAHADEQHSKFIKELHDHSSQEQKKEAPVTDAKNQEHKSEDIIGNTPYKYVPKKKYRKTDLSVGLEISEKFKESGIKHSGKINGDGTITLTFDGNRLEECNNIISSFVSEKSEKNNINAKADNEIKTFPPLDDIAENRKCARYISENYGKYHSAKTWIFEVDDFLNDVTEKFGDERTTAVFASFVNEDDGRYSHMSKKYAPDYALNDREIYTAMHPILVNDAFENMIRRNLELDRSKQLINEFFKNEYGEDTKNNFLDMTNVDIAYTTTEDDTHDIQVSVDLIHFKTNKYIDDTLVETKQFSDLKEMNDKFLSSLDFNDLVYVTEKQLAPFLGKEPVRYYVEQRDGDTENFYLRDTSVPDKKIYFSLGDDTYLSFPTKYEAQEYADRLNYADSIETPNAEQNKTAINFYRIGDFYEAYGTEAEKAAEILDLHTATKDGEPMVGIPQHIAEEYSQKLKESGYSVNLSEETKLATETKKSHLMFGFLGNGITVYDTSKTDILTNDYPNVAHISNEGTVEYYSNAVSDADKKLIQAHADDQRSEFMKVWNRYSVEKKYEILLSRCNHSQFLEITKTKAELSLSVEQTIDRFFDEVILQEPKRKELKQEQEITKTIEETKNNVSEQAENNSAQVEQDLSETGNISQQVEQDLTVLEDNSSEISSEKSENFRITNIDLGVGGAKEKFQRNIAAIRLLKDLESENKQATPSQQEILSQYVGWGGIQEAFDPNNESWSKEYNELKEVLTDSEYTSARASVLNSHYTTPEVIKAIYNKIEDMGFKGGCILEPSMGVGNFFGMLPENLRDNTTLLGVELDSITGRIAKQLYPDANISIEGFEETKLENNSIDIAVGNVPFGTYKIDGDDYKNELIHDYFFKKSLDKVKSGGIVAFITSKGTLDKRDNSVRLHLAERADLLGAVRLPNNAFLKNAGTGVTTDIIFLKKRDELRDFTKEEIPSWVNTSEADESLYPEKALEGEKRIHINNYFKEHPEMVSGKLEVGNAAYGYDIICRPDDQRPFSELLEKAMSNIKGEFSARSSEIKISEKETPQLPDNINAEDYRNYCYCVIEDKIYFRENENLIPKDFSDSKTERAKQLIHLSETLQELISAQRDNLSDESIKELQTQLNKQYDEFTGKYGILSARGNKNLLVGDDTLPLLLSLEILDDEGNFKEKADIFSKRTIFPYIPVEKVDTPAEALAVSISEKAKVDLDYMSELCGQTKEYITDDLKGIIFENPVTEKYENADEYLSGNVRKKLNEAKQAAENNEKFAVNVAALEQVMPQDLTKEDITAQLGSTWIPTKYYEQFMYELFETPPICHNTGEDYGNPFKATGYDADHTTIAIQYDEKTATFGISNKTSWNADPNNVKVNETYGTSRLNGYKIMEATLNMKPIVIRDPVPPENKKRVVNQKETLLAQEKQTVLKNKFREWIYADPERTRDLCRIYNDKFNSIVPREYNGSNIKFGGINPNIALREHQKNAIARTLYGGNTLFAHSVGAGKTFEIVASAMEGKRLGLHNKSLICVPKAIVGQTAAEFMQLYPGAKILVPNEKDFSKENRQRFCSRIATGNYDAIIISHNQFEKIPLSKEREQEFYYNQLNEIADTLETIKIEKTQKGFTVKQLEAVKKDIERKLDRLINSDKRDRTVTFEDLGVDKLFIDEAHLYKNLFFTTKMGSDVAGINAQSESQRATDLFMKCRYLDELTGSRGTVLATGTPLSNSMSELYVMQKYLQFDMLEEKGLGQFDAWAANFGETVVAMELSPEGYNF